MKKVPEIDSLVGSYGESEGITSTTSTTYINKLTLIFTPQFTGKYSLNWILELCGNSASDNFRYRVRDISVNFVEGRCMNNVSYANGGWKSFAGFKQLNLIKNISYTFYIDFCRATGTSNIRNVRLKINREF
jgi:hypothetical protein